MKTTTKNGLLTTSLLLLLGAIGFLITPDYFEDPLTASPASRAVGGGIAALPGDEVRSPGRFELEPAAARDGRGAYHAPIGTALDFGVELTATARVKRADGGADSGALRYLSLIHI